MAKVYARTIGPDSNLLKPKRGRRDYHLGFNVVPGDFVDVTKRAALVTDVLMLTQDSTGPRIILGTKEKYVSTGPTDTNGGAFDISSMTYGMQCTNIAEVGKWILEAESFLKTGCAWYLPRFVQSPTTIHSSVAMPKEVTTKPIDYDFLIRNGRAIEASGAEPITSQLVRVLFTMRVPYLEGITLREFSRITTEEFNSYEVFKYKLRQNLRAIDGAIEDVQSQRKIADIEDEILHGISKIEVHMKNTANSRSLAKKGVVACMTTVALVAIAKPSMVSLISAIGLNNAGIWNWLKTRAEEGKPRARESDYYYVWALMKDTEVL
ncbi:MULTISPECIES: hypothetical protein [unclassified Streptomyces]|uniref:hypothetical protein n=1 Tax=unclassified Streptomyces TaxID=2593676 RepID=UPI0036EE923B